MGVAGGGGVPRPESSATLYRPAVRLRAERWAPSGRMQLEGRGSCSEGRSSVLTRGEKGEWRQIAAPDALTEASFHGSGRSHGRRHRIELPGALQ